MANTASAKKASKQNVVRRERNLARKTSVKTAIKKVLAAVEQGVDAQALLKDAEAKLSRAQGKGLFHKRAASRKVSRLAKKVAAVQKAKSK